MASLETITDRIRAGVASGNSLTKTLKLNVKGEGAILIDGTMVTNEDGPADLTLTTSMSDLEALGTGRLDPMSAIMTGKLKLSDMALAMKLQPQLQALFGKLR